MVSVGKRSGLVKEAGACWLVRVWASAFVSKREPAMVNEAVMARAEATSATAAEQVRELAETRAM